MEPLVDTVIEDPRWQAFGLAALAPGPAIAASAPQAFSMEVTPASECVAAPARDSLAPTTKPLARARSISAAEVVSVR